MDGRVLGSMCDPHAKATVDDHEFTLRYLSIVGKQDYRLIDSLIQLDDRSFSQVHHMFNTQ